MLEQWAIRPKRCIWYDRLFIILGRSHHNIDVCVICGSISYDELLLYLGALIEEKRYVLWKLDIETWWPFVSRLHVKSVSPWTSAVSIMTVHWTGTSGSRPADAANLFVRFIKSTQRGISRCHALFWVTWLDLSSLNKPMLSILSFLNHSVERHCVQNKSSTGEAACKCVNQSWHCLMCPAPHT